MYTLEELYEIDRKGKEIALKYMDRADKIAYRQAINWLSVLEKAVKYILLRALPPIHYDDVGFGVLADEFERAIEDMRYDLDNCYHLGKSFRECKLSDYSKIDMQEVDYRYADIIGRETGQKGCAYSARYDYYNASMGINDITSCFHGVVEYYSKFKLEPIDRESYASEDATDRAKYLCKEWNKYFRKFFTDGVYAIEDAKAVGCVAIGDEAQLKVGSSPGHRTSVDFKNDEVSYYDTDYYVNFPVYLLLKELGLSCRPITKGSGAEAWRDGVVCTGLSKLDKDKISKLAKILASTTSMDFRIHENSDMYDAGEMTGIFWKKPYEKYDNIKECFDKSTVNKIYNDLSDRDKRIADLLAGYGELGESRRYGMLSEVCAVTRIYEE